MTFLEICHSVGESIKDNWSLRVDGVKYLVGARGKCVVGRVIVVNSLALSQLWYTATVVSKPDTVVDEVNKLTLNFISDENIPLVSQTTSFGRLRDG